MTDKDPQFDSYAAGYKDVVKKSTDFIPVQEDFYLHAKLDLLSEMISKLPANAKIVDFGCGVGGIVIPLSKIHLDKTFYAFDVSPQSVEKIQELKIPNIHCMSSEKELSSEVLSSTFDLIFSVNVFHHIDRSERSGKVQLLKNLLKKGGRLLILEHNPMNPLTRIVVSRCEFDEGVELLGRRELRLLMESNSLEVVRHWYILFFPLYNKFLSRIEKLLSFLPLGAQHCMEGIKK